MSVRELGNPLGNPLGLPRQSSGLSSDVSIEVGEVVEFVTADTPLLEVDGMTFLKSGYIIVGDEINEYHESLIRGVGRHVERVNRPPYAVNIPASAYKNGVGFDGEYFHLAANYYGYVVRTQDFVTYSSSALTIGSTSAAIAQGILDDGTNLIAYGKYGSSSYDWGVANTLNKATKLKESTLSGVISGVKQVLDMAFGNGLYVTVGITTNYVAGWGDKPNAFNVISGLSFEKVVFGNGVFIGYNASKVVVSATVKTLASWTEVDVKIPLTGATISFCNGRFFALGAEGEMSSSVDGYTWSLIQQNMSGALYNIFFLGGQYCVFGAGKRYFSATFDSPKWVLEGNIHDVSSGANIKVVSGNGLLMAVTSSSYDLKLNIAPFIGCAIKEANLSAAKYLRIK